METLRSRLPIVFGFWLLISLIVLLRLFLVSDLAIQMIYSPHDDGLYVSRAFHLLQGEAFGPYDARLLVKIPGLSLWIAGSRLLGIPYLLSINLLYISAGIFFITALERCGFHRIILLFIFIIYLFNPVTFDHQWFRVMREPLSIGLLVVILSSMIFFLNGIRSKQILFWPITILAVSFSFGLLVREEDKLLYALLLFFYILVLGYAWACGGFRSTIIRLAILAVILMPLIFAFTGKAMVRSFISKHYGLPIIHEMDEGEFPKFIAAIRSIEVSKESRHVMVTQESLKKIQETVPRLIPMIERLPPPGPGSYSCARFNICDEWTNGWMLFWIKDAAFSAGLTPDLVSAQKFFHDARLEIQKACQNGQLRCRYNGEGLIPPFQVQWVMPFIKEGTEIVKMMIRPPIGVAGELPETFPVDDNYGRMYQFATMTHYFDSVSQVTSTLREGWKNYPQDLYLSLEYWLRYPDVASAKDFGPHGGGDEWGAVLHYREHGQHEGRIWEENRLSEKKSIERMSLFGIPTVKWRKRIAHFFIRFGLILEILGVIASIGRLLLWRIAVPGPFHWIAIIFFAFTLVRLLALSYVSTYFGQLDPRLFFSTYVIGLSFISVIIFDFVTLFLSWWRIRQSEAFDAIPRSP